MIRGTRFSVDAVVEYVYHLGLTPDEMVRKWPRLTLAEIYDALSYYHDHEAWYYPTNRPELGNYVLVSDRVGGVSGTPVQIQIERHLTYTTLVSRFFAGQYLKETPPGRSVTYVTGFLTYRF